MFVQLDRLLGHLRGLVGVPDHYVRQEARLCDREAQRLDRMARQAVTEAQERELSERRRAVVRRAAQRAQAIGTDALWTGELFLAADAPGDALPYLKDAMLAGGDADEETKAAYLYGLALRRLGRYEEAIDALSRLTGRGISGPAAEGPPGRDRHHPLYVQAFLDQALALVELRRFGEADELFLHLYGLLSDDNPLWKENLYHRGRAKRIAGTSGGKPDRPTLDAARAILEEFVRRFPRGAGRAEAGVDLTDRAQFELAETLRAAAATPADGEAALATYGTLLERIDRRPMPLPVPYEELRSRALWNMAEVAFERGSWDEAAALYRKAERYYRTSPLMVWAHFQLGRCAAAAGKVREARDCFTQGQVCLGGFTDEDLSAVLPGGPGVKDAWGERFRVRLAELDAPRTAGR
jgi:tetratricopeptide (TPR) repeat protein